MNDTTLRRLTEREWAKVDGAFYVGDITTTYAELVKLLGEPDDGDGEKYQVEWRLALPDGTVFTIYDWKICMPIGLNTEWHIGARSENDLPAIKRALKKAFKAQTYEVRIVMEEEIADPVDYIRETFEDVNVQVQEISDNGVKQLPYAISGETKGRLMTVIFKGQVYEVRRVEDKLYQRKGIRRHIVCTLNK